MTQTPRFNLDKYSQGEDNWSHSDTVDLLDELAVETDTIANRDASGNYDDELFYATDQKLLYRWDSGQSDWLIEGGVGNSSDRIPNLWADSINTNTLEADSVNSTYHYASAFDGGDADARLDNALSAASTGDVVFLESATYTQDRTINVQGKLVGPSWGSVGDGTSSHIEGIWTIAGNNSFLESISIASGGEIVVSGLRVDLTRVYDTGLGIRVQSSEVGIYNSRLVDVVYESGTEDGVALGNRSATITDNGSNIIPAGSNS